MTDAKQLQIETLSRGRVKIHCCTSPDDGERVNAQIVETERSLVLIDAMLTRSYARQLRAHADSLGKPIERLIVTHAHPDHCFGIELFQDVPIYALPETIEEIKVFAPLAIEFHRGQHGDDVTDQILLPNRTIEEGSFELDGVEFRLSRILAAEDAAMLVIELPAEKTLIAQDLVYNKVHMFVGQRSMDGTLCFDGWIAALERFARGDYELVIPGHGVPTDASVFQENIAYLKKVREILGRSNGESFVQNVVDAYPAYGLVSMLQMSSFFLFMQG